MMTHFASASGTNTGASARSCDAAADASKAGDLARERLKQASDALLLEASYLDDAKRAALLAQLQDDLVAKTADQSRRARAAAGDE